MAPDRPLDYADHPPTTPTRVVARPWRGARDHAAPLPAARQARDARDVRADPDVSASYRRRARRLRHVHAADPVRLQRSLLNLARGHDAAHPSPAAARTATSAVADARPAVAAVLQAPSAVADRFCEMVERRVEGPVLPYATRKALLRSAASMGIGRFQANLVIAAAQHRRASAGANSSLGDAARGVGRPPTLTRAAGVAALLAAEAIAVAGLWLLLL